MRPPSSDGLRALPPPPSAARVRGRGELRLVETLHQTSFAQIVEIFCRLRLAEAWAEMRSLLSDDARLEWVAAAGVGGPRETIEVMRFASAGGLSLIEEYAIETLADDAVLVHGWPSQPGGTAPSPDESGWLVTGDDGLIRRSLMVASRAEAEHVLEHLGPELGL